MLPFPDHVALASCVVVVNVDGVDEVGDVVGGHALVFGVSTSASLMVRMVRMMLRMVMFCRGYVDDGDVVGEDDDYGRGEQRQGPQRLSA